MNFKVLYLLKFAIRRYSFVHGLTDEFKVIGYTTFQVNDYASDNSWKYYANEYMDGVKKYDYVMLEVWCTPMWVKNS